MREGVRNCSDGGGTFADVNVASKLDVGDASGTFFDQRWFSDLEVRIKQKDRSNRDFPYLPVFLLFR